MEVALNSVVASSPASYSSSTSSLDCTLLSTNLLDGNSIQGSNQNKQNCLFQNETTILDSSIFQNALNLSKNQIDSTTTITTTTTTTSKSNNNSISNKKNKSNSNKININNHDFNQTQNIYQHLQKSPLQKKQQMECKSKTEINATLSSTSLTRAIETLNNQTSSTMLTETLIFNYTCDYDKNSGNNSIGNKIDLANFGTNSSLSPASLQSSATLAVVNGTSSNTTNDLCSILTKLKSSQCTTAQTAIAVGPSSDTELTLSNATAGISIDETNVKTTTNCDSLLAIAAASLPSTSIPINNAKTTKNSTSLSSSVGQTSSIPNGNCNNVIGNSINNGKTNITFKIPSDILDDLASRFIINVPDMELNNLIRVCFQIELAHWFYLDFFCASEDEEVKLQTIGIKQFAMQIFQHIPFLQSHLPSVEKVLEEWKHYKMAVPTFGAILISEDLKYCLLVQSYFAKSSWGFPKGKVNENEDPVHCATREVYEETSFDITDLIVPNDYIEAVINYQYTRLYIVQNVPLATQFMPRTRNEIKCCDWFPIDSLPINKMDAISKTKLGLNANSFFMILPFMKRLKKWVNDRRAGIEPVIRRKCSGIPAFSMGHNGVSISPPLSKSPPNAFNHKNNNNVNGSNCSNNQKFSNGNNSSKKNKQYQYRNNSDEKYALYNSTTDNDKDISGCGEGAAAVLLDISNNKVKNTLNGNMASNGVGNGQFGDKNNCLNNLSTTIIRNTNSITPNNNNNQRSKRQRHKSMGDLDGIKLTNLNSNNNLKNNQSNYNNNDVNNANPVTGTAQNAVLNTNKFYNNSNNNASGGAGNYKRNTIKIGAAGSNSNNINNSGNNNLNSKNGSNTNGLGNNSTKRQLFHSQSQNGTSSHQQQNGDKNGNSFDNGRKEKQQFQKTKIQKQQQQQQQNSLNNSFNGSGRVRAKSQSENQQLLQKSKSGVNNNNNTMNKNRLQRQKSLTYTSSALGNCTKISNKNIKNSNNVKDNIDLKSTKTKMSTGANPPNQNERQHVIQQSRSFTGMDLIALMEKSGATGSLTPVKCEDLSLITTVAQIERACRPRPRPVSVSLHFENNNSHNNNTKQQHQILNGLIKSETLEATTRTKTISSSTTITTTPNICEKELESKENNIKIKEEQEDEQQQPIPLKRYPSGSNLRSLRRFLSQQPQSSLSTSSSTSAESSTSSSNSTAKNASITDILDLPTPNNSTTDGGDAETTLKPFSPNNSWRNFAFTKNFISNVFC